MAMDEWEGQAKGVGLSWQHEIQYLFPNRDYHSIIYSMTAEERALLQKLIGPHGYAIYKALKVRRDS